MKYTFIRNGISEEVKEERWGWGVVYKNDTELHQFDNEGFFHQIKEINWGEVKMFTMYRLKDPMYRIDLLVNENMQVFHFYRNIKPYYLDYFVRIYVFGYKNKNNSEMVYNFILPDDRIIISNKDNVDLTLFNIK